MWLGLRGFVSVDLKSLRGLSILEWWDHVQPTHYLYHRSLLVFTWFSFHFPVHCAQSLLLSWHSYLPPEFPVIASHIILVVLMPTLYDYSTVLFAFSYILDRSATDWTFEPAQYSEPSVCLFHKWSTSKVKSWQVSWFSRPSQWLWWALEHDQSQFWMASLVGWGAFSFQPAWDIG